MEKGKNRFIHLFLVTVLSIASLVGLLGIPIQTEAKILNVEKEGSLTIHKFLNPNVLEGEFQGDGTDKTKLPGDINVNTDNGALKPLPGAEFSVYGRLTRAEVASLVVDGSQEGDYDAANPKPLDINKVANFIEGKEPMNPPSNRKTDKDGKLTISNIPINTYDLSDNLYLVVETKTPNSGPDGEPIVQQPSRPVVVNIPSVNPDKDTADKEVNHYIYDVNLFMKNYHQTEPNIGKTVDKPTHSVGEEVKYTLNISPLAFDMAEYQKLEVKDELAKELDFYRLGHTDGPSIPESVVFFRGEGTGNKLVLKPSQDYKVVTPEVGETGTITWTFTPEGIKKLDGIQEGDGSRIELYFSALTNDLLGQDGALYNDAELDFVNKWGYGTKPPTPENPDDPKIEIAPKPSPSVNTVLGQRYFEKRDKLNNALKLEGAEFLVRNKSELPITALTKISKEDTEPKMVTFPKGTQLYAIIEDGKTVSGWTSDYKLAYDSGWTIKSDAKGQFHVEGLAYTNEVHYRKMYIFSQMKIVKNNKGTEVEVVDKYEYVLAKPRTSKTTEAEIQSDINSHLVDHKGDAKGNGAWKLYKESDASVKKFPNMADPKNSIDYLGDAKNSYELIEVRAPEGYAPIENVKYTEPGNKPTPEADPYEHPFAFTVPGLDSKSKPIYGVPDYSGDLKDPNNNVVAVPNAKMPKIPLTGGIGTIIFLVAGIARVGIGFVIKRRGKAAH